MIVLHIEHPAPDFDAWKAAFDSDPAFRKKSGVRSYRVLRPIDTPNFAIIDLEFPSLSEAESLLATLQQVWRRVDGTIIHDPQWRISELVETKDY